MSSNYLYSDDDDDLDLEEENEINLSGWLSCPLPGNLSGLSLVFIVTGRRWTTLIVVQKDENTTEPP